MEVNNYFLPENLSEAYEKLVEDKQNHIIAGGAWLKLAVKKANSFISLDKLQLNGIKDEGDYLVLGSSVSLRDVETNDSILAESSGILSQAISKIMGMNIRNQATLGGSVMGKFAFSDIITPLLVMDTKLVFYKAGEMTLQTFLDNKKMNPDILTEIKIRKSDASGFFKKVAKTALDFAVINVAITLEAKKFKIAIGSRPQIAGLALKAMEYINSQTKITDEIIENTANLAVEELSFSDNNRASKTYREEVARVYVKRGIKQVMNNES